MTKPLSTKSDLQFFDTLERSAEFLYRQGVGEGAAAVDEAIRRLQSKSTLTLRGVRPRGLGRWLWYLLDRHQKPVVQRGAEYVGEVSR